MSTSINGFAIVTGPKELMKGYEYGDYSRIALYNGDLGLKTGSFSPTVGRHNQQFGQERQTTLNEFFK